MVSVQVCSIPFLRGRREREKEEKNTKRKRKRERKTARVFPYTAGGCPLTLQGGAPLHCGVPPYTAGRCFPRLRRVLPYTGGGCSLTPLKNGLP